MAPSTSASLTIPLVFALSGNATWFVYLLATGSMLLVGFCVSRFARLSASPGSLYTYTANTLPPVFGVLAAWGLLLAYLATGASVAGGALYYASVLSQQFFHWAPPAVPTLAVVCAVAASSPTAMSSSPPKSCCGLKQSLSPSFWLCCYSFPCTSASGSTPANSVCGALPFPQWDPPSFSPSSASWALKVQPPWAAKRASLFVPFPARYCSARCSPVSSSCSARTLRCLASAANPARSVTPPARSTCSPPGRRIAARGRYRLRRVRQHVCLRAGLLHRSRASSHAHGARRAAARRSRTNKPTPWNAGSSRDAFDAAHVHRRRRHGSAWRNRFTPCTIFSARSRSSAFSRPMLW